MLKMNKLRFSIFIFMTFIIRVFGQEATMIKYSVSASRIQNREIRLDGVFDEKVWKDAEAITELIQCEPSFGIPFSERTVVQILYDDDNIYVGSVCNYKDMDDMVADKLSHRDIDWDDTFFFIFDTFHDRTKGYCFGTNALGGKDDGFVDGPTLIMSNCCP